MATIASLDLVQDVGAKKQAAIANRKANRAAARAYASKLVQARIVAPPSPELRPVASELTAAELIRLHDLFLPFVPTDAWAATIIEALQVRRTNGKRLVPYAITDDGRMKTKFPRLLELVSTAGVFPPPADDIERCYLQTGTHHVGSEMALCWCRDCGGERLWPRQYIVDGWISYTCLQNRRPPADWAEPVVQEAQRVTSGDISEQVVYDADAWRADGINKLWHDHEDIDHRPIASALRKWKWNQVVGGKKARIEKRGLSTVGALADFVYLGHDLKAVVGGAADDLISRLNAYSREPRKCGVRMAWQRLKVRKRKQ